MLLAALVMTPLLACGGSSADGGEPDGSVAMGDDDDAGAHGDAGSNGGDRPDAGDPDQSGDDGGAEPEAKTRLIAYLPTYRGSYADWAERIDFTKMTHLNLAFANPGDDGYFGIGQSDEEVKALVHAAHAAGTKVLASLGGGGGDQILANGYEQHDAHELVANLDAFVTRLELDGVDVDMEAPGRMHQEYLDFVDACVETFRPQGKLVTAAVAPWIQEQLDQEVTTHMLAAFDFVNIMSYSDMTNTMNDLAYYEGLGVPREEMVVGVRFFGNDGNGEVDYSHILELYPDAWMYDEIHDDGYDVYYTGPATMATFAELSKGYGGIMFWELGEDVSGEHSLYGALQDAL
jgi:GH18 family chitinase